MNTLKEAIHLGIYLRDQNSFEFCRLEKCEMSVGLLYTFRMAFKGGLKIYKWLRMVEKKAFAPLHVVADKGF